MGNGVREGNEIDVRLEGLYGEKVKDIIFWLGAGDIEPKDAADEVDAMFVKCSAGEDGVTAEEFILWITSKTENAFRETGEQIRDDFMEAMLLKVATKYRVLAGGADVGESMFDDTVRFIKDIKNIVEDSAHHPETLIETVSRSAVDFLREIVKDFGPKRFNMKVQEVINALKNAVQNSKTLIDGGISEEEREKVGRRVIRNFWAVFMREYQNLEMSEAETKIIIPEAPEVSEVTAETADGVHEVVPGEKPEW